MKEGNCLKSEKTKRLAKNTVFLYIMTISTYVLNLVTIPYLTRVLGPTVYGTVGVAVGYMSYIQIFLDFGFILSATQLISENREKKDYISQIIISVTIVKVIISMAVFTLIAILYYFNFFERTVVELLFVYVLAYMFSALLPDYFYRGVENMKLTSVRTVIIKVIFTCLVFLFVKDSQDVIYIPISVLLGNFIALIFTIYDLKKNYQLKMIFPSFNQIKNIVIMSFPFFVSRFASTFYQAMNIIVLGKIYGTSPVVGYYSSSDKIIALAKTGSSPIADSLYPYMLANKNFKLIKKMLIILMPIITIGVVVVGVYAEPICTVLFGEEYRDAGKILQLLLPIAWVILPSYIIAFPVMSPLGLVKYTNISNVIGAIMQIAGLFILAMMDWLNVYTICALTSFTEVSVFIFRVSVVMISQIRKRK